MKQLAEKFSDDEIKEAMEKLKKDPRNGLKAVYWLLSGILTLSGKITN